MAAAYLAAIFSLSLFGYDTGGGLPISFTKERTFSGDILFNFLGSQFLWLYPTDWHFFIYADGGCRPGITGTCFAVNLEQTIWEQNRKQLAYKPFVVAQASGKGYVIGFTQEPTVRAYLDGLNLIFMNAILRGSAHARPVR